MADATSDRSTPRRSTNAFPRLWAVAGTSNATCGIDSPERNERTRVEHSRTSVVTKRRAHSADGHASKGASE